MSREKLNENQKIPGSPPCQSKNPSWGHAVEAQIGEVRNFQLTWWRLINAVRTSGRSFWTTPKRSSSTEAVIKWDNPKIIERFSFDSLGPINLPWAGELQLLHYLSSNFKNSFTMVG